MLKGDDLKGAMQTYVMIGLPGNVGSIDTMSVRSSEIYIQRVKCEFKKGCYVFLRILKKRLK